MKRTVLTTVSLLTALVGVGVAAQGQEFEPPKPTPQHELLKKDEGTWDDTIRVYGSGPNAPPQESKGVETNTLLKGGLWLATEFEGELGGQKFQGRGLSGYDARKKKYVLSWVDSMASALSVMEGTYDEATRTLTMRGEVEDPKTGKTIKEKQVTEYKEDGTRRSTTYISLEGSDEMMVLEILSKPRKK